MPRTVIVVPCFNEAARLDGRRFVDAVDRDPRVEFLFVDDGSRDATLPRLQFLAAERPGRIGWLHLEKNSGKAEAVRRGVCAAFRGRPEHVGYWDADLATPLDEIPRFRAVLDRRPDVRLVIGTRLPLLGRTLVRKRSRRLLGRLFARAASWTIGLPIFDTQCGAKLFRADAETERLFAEPFLSKWIFDVELFARLATGRISASVRRVGSSRLEARATGQGNAADAVYELPLENWRDVAGSKLRGRDFLRAIGELAIIRWRYFGLGSKGRQGTVRDESAAREGWTSSPRILGRRGPIPTDHHAAIDTRHGETRWSEERQAA
ncbi:MAG: glycosyltransferase [Planctomycetaceae bacterium]